MEFLNFLHSRVLIFAGTLCLHYSLILNFAKVQKCSIFRDCILLWKVAQFAFRKINLLETQPRKIEKSLILPRVLFKGNLEISNLQTEIENFPSLFADPWTLVLSGHIGSWQFWQVCPHKEFQKMVVTSFENF